MCIMLTSACDGNVATSICNAVLSNMAGIFVTPSLLLHFFGTEIKLPFVQMVLKLCKKVLLPVGKFALFFRSDIWHCRVLILMLSTEAVGQALRATKVKGIYEANSKFFKRLQEVRTADIL